MSSLFDPRVVPPEVVEVLRACQEHIDCRLGGGAALSGAHLAHRLSRDVALVCRASESVRTLVRVLSEVERQADCSIQIVRDAGTFIRASVQTRHHALELDAVFESTPPLEEGTTMEGAVSYTHLGHDPRRGRCASEVEPGRGARRPTNRARCDAVSVIPIELATHSLGNEDELQLRICVARGGGVG